MTKIPHLTMPLLYLAGLAACCGIGQTARAGDPQSWMKLWSKPELESGKIELKRDTTTFAAAPAAMLVDAGAGPTKGSIGRAILARSGQDVTVSAQMKLGAGMKVASLVVNLIGGDGGSHPILVVNQPGDWQQARQAVTIPPGVGMIFVHLSFEGQGKLWIDELKIDGALDTAGTGRLNTFDMPLGYAFGSFTGHATAENGVIHISTADGRGGGGYVVNSDLTRFAEQCPVLSVRRGPKNRAARLKLILEDVDENKRTFEYDVSKASTTEFTQLFPVDGWAVSPRAAGEPDHSFDPGRIKGQLLIGDWQGTPIDVYLDEITLAKPNAQLLELRRAKVAQVAKKLEQEREQQERLAEAREKMLQDGADHPEDGPNVIWVAPVAPDILGVTIQERWRTPGRQVPYEAKPGDEIREEKGGHKYLAWENGKPALVATRTVWRKAEGENKAVKLGILVDGSKTLTTDSTIHGDAITRETLDEPRAYRILVDEGTGKVRSLQPTGVYRKSKPLERATNGQCPVHHVVYLKLPERLKEGPDYTVEFHGINTRQANYKFKHLPSKIPSEAIHTAQIGYRPSDPFKRAYLSLWLGTGGAQAYDVDRFELLDAKTRNPVYTGQVKLGIPADQPEMLRPEKNHNRTNVYWLDFSDFKNPGWYYVHVPGIGLSRPLAIIDDAWLRAFRTSMQGLLAHRSGIELALPLKIHHRPRPFHPDDGMQIFRLDVTMLDGESAAVEKSLRRLLGPNRNASSLKTHPQAWGGYMDAGDWDRRSLHIRISYLQLELFEMFPAYFEEIHLDLPRSEMQNNVPDIVDEALWNLDFYRRLQDADGGVGGGVESTAHPRPGETSWQESLLVGAFAPDPVTSYRYAAAAAKVSGILDRYDRERAAEFRTGAERAWNWAEENGERVIEEVRRRGGKVKDTARETVAEPRSLAAVELYRLTRDDAYHAAFQESSAIATGGDPGSQLDATFAYAKLPDELGDAALKRKALDWLESQGEQALLMSSRNGFNIGCRVPQLPMMGFVGYYTTPETAIGPVLPRLHYLTGDEKYLRGALAVTQYTSGANPVNTCMTTGLGEEYPVAPLHVDSLRTGRGPPRGITIYGPHDPTKAPGWVKTWVLGNNLTPPVEQWPASEFHIDVSAWPEMSEYTVHQSIGPTGYYWGYLAARAAEARP